MEDAVNITVDGFEMQVPKGTLLWEACKAHGIDIPIFCYHTKLGPVGACRTCLVELEGGRAPITACSTPVADGMKVRTKSPTVQKAQAGIFEFLLANHPLDCPICDRGGECPLQDQTFTYGPGSSRYVEPKRHHVKPIALGPTIALDRERCVLCWRCVRFTAEVAEDKSIVLLDRGDHTVVGTFQDEPYVSQFSGNVVELCPVGALTSRKQRFNFRPWELSNRPSVCPHCPMGCNINISVRKNDEVIRFLSRDNPDVDDSWLCDRGRYDFAFINSAQRLTSPLIRRGEGFVEASWEEALDYIAERTLSVLHDEEEGGPDAIAGIASPRLTNEDLFVFKEFMARVLGSPNIDHYPRPQARLTAVQQDRQRDLDHALMPIAGLDAAKTILLLGADPSRREPVMELRIRLAVNRHRAKLVVANSEDIPLSDRAHARLRYPVGQIATFARSLAAAARGAGKDTDTPDELPGVVREYLTEGPIAVLYDDAFDGVADPGDALEAITSAVDALGAGVIPMLDDCNSMGARDLALLPAAPGGGWAASTVEDLLSPDSQLRVAFLLGADLMKGRPQPQTLARLRRLDLLVVHEVTMTETARYADVVLPAASFAEKDGTFTNTEGRVQRIWPAVPAPGVARPDWEILVDLSQHFDGPLEYAEVEEVWSAVRRAIPKYAALAFAAIGPRGALARALQPV